MSAAVANALTARAAGDRWTGAAGTVAPPRPTGAGDARDRLLAVLLGDPVRAVAATVELDTCRDQVGRLQAALRHERTVLGDVLRRLAATGLQPEQLATLARLPVDEVRELLDPAAAAER